MSMFNKGSDDNDDDDFDGNMFSRRDSYEERQAKRVRAQEIASGLTCGTFERDEEVWKMVAELREKQG